jgi:hypothetical protein
MWVAAVHVPSAVGDLGQNLSPGCGVVRRLVPLHQGIGGEAVADTRAGDGCAAHQVGAEVDGDAGLQPGFP